jgi:D-alanyl-D-alanine dipeptidase
MLARFSTTLFLTALVAGCQLTPPRESGQFRETDLVEVIKLEPTIRLEVRYATTNNFLHRPVYAQAKVFLQRPAAEALVRAQRALKARGYGLVLFDGYRPWSVTKIFWDSASAEERRIGFVADPRKGSRHNRGCAVDLSLVDLGTGAEVTMPSGYDEFSERAFPTYQGGTPESRALRDLLRQVMEAEGFTVYPAEWWHFDYRDWKQYRILNIPFEALGR